jgi:hypothetical protein
MLASLQVLADGLELLQRPTTLTRICRPDAFQAMIQMVVHQGPFGLGNCLLYRVELLRDVEAGTSFLDHGDDGSKVTFDSLKPLHDLEVALMTVRRCVHGISYPAGGDKSSEVQKIWFR